MKTKCKTCKTLIERIKDGTKTKNRYKYRDSLGKLWNGKDCPTCYKGQLASYKPTIVVSLEDRKCKICDNPISKYAHGRTKYCSKQCSKESIRMHYLENKPKTLKYQWICQFCDIEFTTTFAADINRGGIIRFCSGSCRDTSRRRRALGLKIGEGKCVMCGNIYTKANPKLRACDDCKAPGIEREAKKRQDIAQREANRIARKELKLQEKEEIRQAWLNRPRKPGYKHKHIGKPCLICESPILKKGMQKYCSKKCQNKASRNNPKVKAARKESKRLRKRAEIQRKLDCVTWIDISNIYEGCPKGSEVDHIIPLNHKDVSGLHVPWNMQYLPRKENQRKSNKFDGTYENEGWV